MMFRECVTAEADVGMKFYLTDVDGSGGKLKTEAEDFIVREISSHPEKTENGRFCIADVTTKNWETNRLIRILSRSIGMSRERIGFAGTKDKRAVTTQLMSFECTPEQLATVDLKDVSISNVYQAKRGIQIGDLKGNAFEIRVKNCTPSEENISLITEEITRTGGFPNYFGVQRFGSARPITHIVGEKIVRGDLKGAIDAYLLDTSEFESEDVTEARKVLAEDPKEAVKIMPKSMSFEKMIAEHLIKRPDDMIGAISSLPSNLQMMFVHAYQSYLFNQMLSERMRLGIPLNEPVSGDVVIPMDRDGNPMHEMPTVVTEKNMDLVAKQVKKGRAYVTITLYGSESVIAEGSMGEIERKMIEKEKIERKDFIVAGLPQCSSKGSRREIICPVKDLSHTIDKNSYEMRFSLTKGNYATCLMREYMKSDMERY